MTPPGPRTSACEDGTGSRVSAFSLMFAFDGLGIVDVAVVDTSGGPEESRRKGR